MCCICGSIGTEKHSQYGYANFFEISRISKSIVSSIAHEWHWKNVRDIPKMQGCVSCSNCYSFIDFEMSVGERIIIWYKVFK